MLVDLHSAPVCPVPSVELVVVFDVVLVTDDVEECEDGAVAPLSERSVFCCVSPRDPVPGDPARSQIEVEVILVKGVLVGVWESWDFEASQLAENADQARIPQPARGVRLCQYS